jgi:glycosyltransferase involved in cell wall biosynthesis
MPSRNEPLGKVMLESMMCGTPVIATETEGPRDHIINGENGFLFRAGKTEDLTNFLHYAINNKSQIKAMGENAHQYVYQKFSWENILKQIIDTVYIPIMNEYLDNQCLQSGSCKIYF